MHILSPHPPFLPAGQIMWQTILQRLWRPNWTMHLLSFQSSEISPFSTKEASFKSTGRMNCPVSELPQPQPQVRVQPLSQGFPVVYSECLCSDAELHEGRNQALAILSLTHPHPPHNVLNICVTDQIELKDKDSNGTFLENVESNRKITKFPKGLRCTIRTTSTI